MRRSLFMTLAAAALYIVLHFGVCLFVPAPISAEYWVREMIAIKKRLASASPPPRILFLGGSSTLFGIDAGAVEKATGVRAVNLGLHAGMRLERVLAIGEDVAQRGDVLVLALEHVFYGCNQLNWTSWQLSNALAWDRDYFDSLPLTTRLSAIYAAGDPFLSAKTVAARLGVAAGLYSDRLRALGPADEIYTRYQSGALATADFAYSAYNLDGHGGMRNNTGALYTDAGVPPNEPGHICPAVLTLIRDFTARMTAKGARLFVAHTPYLTDGIPNTNWPDAERNFVGDIAVAGATILGRREQLFLPRRYFFNTNQHLNDEGRRIRTNDIVAALKALGVGPETGQQR